LSGFGNEIEADELEHRVDLADALGMGAEAAGQQGEGQAVLHDHVGVLFLDVAQLVAGVGGTGDPFAQEDFLVG
jgi:hypothetical protein